MVLALSNEALPSFSWCRGELDVTVAMIKTYFSSQFVLAFFCIERTVMLLLLYLFNQNLGQNQFEGHGNTNPFFGTLHFARKLKNNSKIVSHTKSNGEMHARNN